jgi:hypothetical protein
MHRKSLVATSVAALVVSAAAVAVPLEAAAAPSPTSVVVRVEGVDRTLLAPTAAHTHTGWITTGGTPVGKCPATSAAGALDVATHHDWTGKYSASIGGLFLNAIRGETQDNKTYYWSVWIDNRYASKGVCDLKLHAGDTLLFAPDAIRHHEHPIGIEGPAAVTVGHSFTVKVVRFSDAGVPKPLAGATVTTANAVVGQTNRHGVLTIVAKHAGTLVLRAAESGYIRAAPVRVGVSG